MRVVNIGASIGTQAFYVQSSAANGGKLAKRTLVSDALLVKVADNTVSTISLSDLKSLALTSNIIISTVVAGNDKVDTVVVTTTARPTVGAHTDGGTGTATTDFAVASDALLKAVGTAGTYKTGVTVAGNLTDAAKAVSAITDKDEYAAAKSAMDDLKILADDIIAADGTGNTIQNKVWTAGKAAYDIYAILSKAEDAAGANNTSVAWAGKNVIVANVTNVGSKVKTTGAVDTNGAAFLAEVPTSVTIESLDGTTYDISNITKPAADNTKDTLTACGAAITGGTGWYWKETAAFDGQTAGTYTLELTAGVANTAAYAGTANNVKFSFTITNT